MIVQKEHWNGQPRPASKLVILPPVRSMRAAGSRGVGTPSSPGRSCHEIRRAALQPLPHGRHGSTAVEPTFGLPGEERDAERLGGCGGPAGMSGSIARHPLTWKPPMATCTPARRSRVPRCRPPAGTGSTARPPAPRGRGPPAPWIRSAMRSGRTRVLVSSMASMTRSTSSPSTLRRAAQSSAKPLKHRERVGRDGRAQPLDDVAVVVVVRRLDQDEGEESSGRWSAGMAASWMRSRSRPDLTRHRCIRDKPARLHTRTLAGVREDVRAGRVARL